MLPPLHDVTLGALTVKYNKNTHMLRKDPLTRVKHPRMRKNSNHVKDHTHHALCVMRKRHHPPFPPSPVLKNTSPTLSPLTPRTLYSTECPSRSSISKCRARLISPSPHDKPAFIAHSLDSTALAMRMRILILLIEGHCSACVDTWTMCKDGDTHVLRH